MAKTVYRIQNTFDNVQAFVWLITNSSGVIFENINTAASIMLKVVVLDDFSRMQRIIEYCVNNYNTDHATVVGGIQHSINWVTHSESFPGEIRASNDIFRNSALRYLQSILTIGTDSGGTSRDFVTRLIRRPDQWKQCRSMFVDFAVILGNVSGVEYGIRRNNSQGHISSWYDIRQDFFPCLHSLNAEMARVGNVNKRMLKTVQNILHSSMSFSYGRFLLGARSNIEDLQQIIVWISEQMQLYAQNRTTKLELSRNTTITQINEVQSVINKIMAELTQNVIDQLLVLGGTIEKEVRKVYVMGLSGMMALDEYYDNGYIEDELRMLKIWRQPVFQFRIPEVVGFKYPASQSWRSWPTTTTLRQFVLEEAHDKIISKITNHYGNEMQQEVLRWKVEFTRMKNEIIFSLNQLYDEMERIRRESTMGEAFVM